MAQRATHSQREKFVALIQQHAGGTEADRYAFAQRLMRFGATYAAIQERFCNGHDRTGRGDWDEEAANRDERKESSIESAVAALCAKFACKPVFAGDPRGATIKIAVPDGYTDDWGKEGICVPTS